MSYAIIRQLLEQRLNAVSGGLSTAYENVPFTPVAGTPFQRVHLLPADTDNPTLGDGFCREQGILQVLLQYPLRAGAAAAAAQAELLREGFKRGTTLTNGTLRVLIQKSPSIAPALPSDAWFLLPVSVPFIADVFG